MDIWYLQGNIILFADKKKSPRRPCDVQSQYSTLFSPFRVSVLVPPIRFFDFGPKPWIDAVSRQTFFTPSSFLAGQQGRPHPPVGPNETGKRSQSGLDPSLAPNASIRKISVPIAKRIVIEDFGFVSPLPGGVNPRPLARYVPPGTLQSHDRQRSGRPCGPSTGKPSKNIGQSSSWNNKYGQRSYDGPAILAVDRDLPSGKATDISPSSSIT